METEEQKERAAKADTEFRFELQRLLNRFSRENGSDTPDFVLAKYLADCLAAYDGAVRWRDELAKPLEN